MNTKGEVVKKFEFIGDYIERFGFNSTGSPDFFIYRYRDVKEYSSYNLRSFRNSFFEISFDLSIGCPYVVDNFKCLSGKNRISVISPYRLQSIIAADSPSYQIEGYSLFFHSNFLDLHPGNKILAKWFPFFTHTSNPVLQLTDDSATKFVTLFENILLHQQCPSSERKNILRHYTYVLLLLLKEQYATEAVNECSRESEIYTEFTLLLENHFLEFTSVHQFAEKLHLSTKHFSESIKQVCGKTVIQLINERKTDFAKALLSHTDLSPKQIAGELRFENESYFYTFFKRMTHTTPSEFRKK